MEQLARAQFPDPPLTAAEIKLLQAAPKGEFAYCGPSEDWDDPSNDPSKADQWSQDRVVRRELLHWICGNREAKDLVDPKGLQVAGARIEGDLDLTSISIPFGLILSRCRLTGPITLQDANLRSVDLSGSQVAGVVANGAIMEGSLFLNGGFASSQEVQIIGTRIEGDFVCGTATFGDWQGQPAHANAKALSADGAMIRGSVFLDKGFKAKGELRLIGTRIGGVLDCSSGLFDGGTQDPITTSATALNADRVVVSGTVFLADGFRAIGQVRFLGAQIGAGLHCVGGSFENAAQAGVAGSGIALEVGEAVVKNAVTLSHPFNARGEVRLNGAQIEGDVDCYGGSFANAPQHEVDGSGTALSADNAVIKGGVFLSDKFNSKGEVRLLNAQIDGNLFCNGGTFANPGQAGIDSAGIALEASRSVVKSGVYLTGAFRAVGQVRFTGAHIEGDLDCNAGQFENSVRMGVLNTGTALGGDSLAVKGNVHLRNGFRAVGEVNLLGAQIGGDLDCSSGSFENPDLAESDGSRYALLVARAEVKGAVLLSHGFTAKGQVDIDKSRIGSDLDCEGGSFESRPPSGAKLRRAAVTAVGAVTNGSVLFRNGFKAVGEVVVQGAQIGGDLDCQAGSFGNELQAGVDGTGTALAVDGTVVKGDLLFSGGFDAKGRVGLVGSVLNGDLDCGGSSWDGELDMERADVHGIFFWTGIVNPKTAKLDLQGTKVGALEDDKQSWDEIAGLQLDGFVYSRISGGPKDAKTRIEWLSRQVDFSTQPYRQLAKVLSESGDEDGASQVLVEMERLRRKKEGEWFSSPLLRWTFGYGYEPLLSFWGLCGLSALGWLIYRRALNAGTMTPTDRDAYTEFKKTGVAPPNYPRFFPAIYSLENSLPLVKLGQADHWQPDPQPRVFTATREKWPRRLIRFLSSPSFARWFLWAQILLGWVFATLFAAGVTGIIHK